MSTIVKLNERKTFSRPRREQNNGYRIKNTEGRAASLSGSRLYGIVNTTEDREHVKTAAEQTSVNTNDYVHNAKFAADQASVNTNDYVHNAKFAADQPSVNTNDNVHHAKFAADQPSVNTNDNVHNAKFAMQLRHLLLPFIDVQLAVVQRKKAAMHVK